MIFVGNCIEWLESLRDDSADVTIADPPYSEHVHAKSLSAPSKGVRNPSGKTKRRTPVARDLGFDHLTPEISRAFCIEAARVTKRWVIVFSCEQNIGAWRWDLQGAGLEVVRVMPWIKPNCAPQMTGDRPAAAWEAIVLAHRRGRKRWNGGGDRGYFVHDVPRGPERFHSTEKPIGLLLELVDLFSDPGELVIDPFAGAATTGAACIRLGRRFEGAELDAGVAEKAVERLSAEREGHTISMHRAKQTVLFPTGARA